LKKLIYLLTLSIIIVIISIYLLNLFQIGYRKKNYNSAFITKLILLKKFKTTKKIILIGGSSVGFGISAKLIENEIGIKTLNLGHHYGFGLTDYIQLLMNNLNKEDLIIFSPEWIFYSDPYYVDKNTLSDLYRYNKEYGQILNNNLYRLFFFLPKLNHDILINQKFDSVYNFNCLNDNGDIISNVGMRNRSVSRYKINKVINVNKFISIFPFLKTNRVIFLFPPTQSYVYNKYKHTLNLIQLSLEKLNFEILNNVHDNVYYDSSFFDTQYHLNEFNKILRTRIIIKYLNKSISR